MTAPAPVVAKDAKYVPIDHFVGARHTRTQWLVGFTRLADDTAQRCCASTHGHRTKAAAKACLVRTLNRLIAEATR